MSISKKQDLPSGLWVVATPIGNLSDLSDRARQALSEAPVLLCEDTRQGAKLLSALGIPVGERRLERLDAHSTDAKLDATVRKLTEGASAALITDAGTPAISDPGSRLVARAHAAGVRVTPVPGPSAVATLLSISGFESGNFTFRAFFPRKAKDRESELELVRGSAVSRVYLWFESPERIEASLALIAEKFPDLSVAAAKELTKIHEKTFIGTAKEVAEQVRAELGAEGERGEWCFAIEFAEQDRESQPSDGESSDWVKALACLLDARVPASEAARQVSHHFGASRKIVYEHALKLSGKKV